MSLIILGISTFSDTSFFGPGLADILIYLLFFLSAIIFFSEIFGRSEQPALQLAIYLLGIFYVILPFSILILLNDFDKNSGFFSITVCYFLLLWTYDTFAYLIGIKLGRHKLCERISPNKTWEGAIGGSLFALVLSYLFSIYFPMLTLGQWLIMAVIIIVFGTLGDLTESRFKRSASCKNSGNLFPGHGGVLDRFDAVLLSIPFVFIYLTIINIL